MVEFSRYKRSLRLIGTAVSVVFIIISWLAMAETLQRLEESYDNQFFEAYFVRSFSSILYIVWIIWKVFPGNCSCNEVGEGKLDKFWLLLAGVFFLACIGFPSDIFWYISLAMTRISANTAIYQSSPALVFVMSIFILKERVTLTKLISVVSTIVGVCLISFYPFNILDEEENASNGTMSRVSENSDDDDEEYEHFLGYVYVVISVVFYALYETCYKRLATKEDDTAPIWNVVRVLGYIGVITMFMFWPWLVIAHFTGLEKFELPQSWSVFLELLAVCAMDLTFNFSLLICITLSSPLFASVASILTIPGAVFLDWLLKNYLMSWQALVGVGTIILGFIGLTVSELMEARMKMKLESGDGESERLLPDESQEFAIEDSKQNLCKRNWFRKTLKNIRNTLLKHIV